MAGTESNKSQWILLLIVVLCLFQYSLKAHAVYEQERTFQEQYSTALGFYSANGFFQPTEDEKEVYAGGGGFFLELHPRESAWIFRVDSFTVLRETGDINLGIRNYFHELRAWGMGFYDVTEVFSLYAGGGLGFVFPDNTMTVLGQTRVVPGRGAPLGGAILGFRLRSNFGLFFDFWRQSIYATVYPRYELSTYAIGLGYQF